MGSIFGTLPPLFKSMTGTEVNIYHATWNQDYLVSELIEHKSIFSGVSKYIPLGQRVNIVFNVNLLKYPDPNSAFMNFKQYDHTEVKELWLSENGAPFYTLNGSPSKFYVETVKPYYLTQDQFYDACTITMKSTDYVTLVLPDIQNYGTQYGYYYGYNL